MTNPQYQGILFPDRAENLREFEGYKVFLEHWDSLGTDLRGLYEGLALRRDTRALAIFGEQGTGKTLFADKLADDIERTRDAWQKGQLTPESSNLWHRICGTSELDIDLIARATSRVAVHKIENTKGWVDEAVGWLRPQADRHCILVADNAERGYFRQGLLNLSDAEYVQMGESAQTMKLVAQNFIAKCRAELRGSLFILLSNDEAFLLNFWDATEKQHEGLVALAQLPLPRGADKETVIRVNTNRLNRISYWFCLDKAGPEDKKAVRSALLGATTYPAAFAAVNDAIRAATPSRVGRPAKKNMITLVLLAGMDSGLTSVLDDFATPAREEFNTRWAVARVFSEGWSAGVIDNERERQLLESEWDLRIVCLGTPFVAALLSNDVRIEHCNRVLELLRRVLGPGTHTSTREETRSELELAVDEWPSLDDVNISSFWQRGQSRALEYEDALRGLMPGYNTGGSGFLGYRPDCIVSPFKPCAVTGAISDDADAINIAIRRDAHTFEVTAQQRPTAQSVRHYLSTKLRNYVTLTQEQ
jgi:hypothetical protein